MTRWLLVSIALASCRENTATQPAPVASEMKPIVPPAPAPPPSPAPTPKPILTTSCTTDTDCAVTSLLDDCCWSCGQHALTKTSLADLEAYCKGKGGNCPAIDCPFQPLKAVCRKGACIGIIK